MGPKRYLLALLAPASALFLTGRHLGALAVHLLGTLGIALCVGLSMHIRYAWAGVLAVTLLIVVLVARESESPGDPSLPTLRRVAAALSLCTYWPTALVLAFAISPLELYRVPTTSMEPTILPGDLLLMDGWAYKQVTPRRGDVIIFRAPDARNTEYVKRVVALPGEQLAVRDHRVQVEGRPLFEPHIQVLVPDPSLLELPNLGPLRVPEAHLFVMGDNRVHSVDSRNYGPVPLRAVRGRVLWGVWPFSRFRALVPRPGTSFPVP